MLKAIIKLCIYPYKYSSIPFNGFYFLVKNIITVKRVITIAISVIIFLLSCRVKIIYLIIAKQLVKRKSSLSEQPVSNTVSTISTTPSNIRLRQNLSGIHYRLKLRPDFYDDNDTADYRFYGEVNIQFRCLEVMTSIVLHANQLVIDSQRLKGSTGNEVKVKRLTEDKDLQWLNFTLDEALVPGSDYQLQVNFSGPLKNDMEGIYWSSYLENNITK